MSSFVLKLIAIISMFCDHSGDAIIGHLSTLNIIGRMAFPIFAFQLVVGFINTKNIKKYTIRLGIFSLISQAPFMFFMNLINGNIFTLNIFFTLLLGLLTLYIYDNVSNKYIKWSSIILIIILGQLARVDYGGWGIFLILFIYLFCPKFKSIKFFNNHITLKYIIFILGYLLLCIYINLKYINLISTTLIISLILFTFLPIIFMFLYNNKKGPSLKYFFYIFYPLHLTILCFINLLINFYPFIK